MSELDGLLSYAETQEEKRAQEETEKLTFIFWTANYMLSKIAGSELISYQELLKSTLSPVTDNGQPQNTPPLKAAKTPEEIIAELMPFVEADRLKGG